MKLKGLSRGFSNFSIGGYRQGYGQLCPERDRKAKRKHYSPLTSSTDGGKRSYGWP